MSLWSAEQRPIPGGVQLHWRRDGQPATLAEWVIALRDEPQARAALNDTLAQTPYKAFFWESLPLARATAQHPARQDVLDAERLARVGPDLQPFAAQLKAQPGASVLQFENLSGDALLVVPAPLTTHDAYPHLAAFTRLAPAAQQDALWAEVGRAAAPFLAQEAPRWLSTAGLGVSWLHVRLDTQPKYYRSVELRRWPPESPPSPPPPVTPRPSLGSLMRRVALALGVLLLALVVALGVGVATTPSRQPVVAPATEKVDAEAMTRHLAEAIRFRTVSAARAEDLNREALSGLIAWMAETYPQTHSQLTREVVGGYSLLYTWPGADPSLPPILLMSHMDVVPVENEAEWTHPPFDGVIADGALWGRGAMDDKSGVVGILEAVEGLLAEGFVPQRTVYLSFGHDEETLGEGSLAVAALLRERGVRLSWVLDEGMVITDGIIAGVKAPAALIGVGERGYLSVRIEATDEGGHSSMPPPTTAAGRVARAVARLEANPFPAGLDGPASSLFAWLAPEMRQPLRTVFSNLWLLRPVVISQMTQKPSTNALARTTQAVTMLSGSLQDNVLPQRAWAVVNLRLHPRDTQASALARLAEVIDDPTITLSPYPSGLNGEPSPISRDVGAPGFDTITGAIRALRPDVVVAPGLTVGATDARRFVDLADDVYRFMPLQLTEPERAAIHGTDERVKLDNLALFPAFYRQVIRRGAGA